MMPLALVLGLLAMGAFGALVVGSTRSYTNTKKSGRFGKADAGFISIHHALAVAGVVIVAILTAVIALQVLSSLFPTYAGSVKNLSSNFTTADWGNSTANSISPIFGLLVSLGGMFAVVGLAFLAFANYSGRGRGGGIG